MAIVKEKVRVWKAMTNVQRYVVHTHPWFVFCDDDDDDDVCQVCSVSIPSGAMAIFKENVRVWKAMTNVRRFTKDIFSSACFVMSFFCLCGTGQSETWY
jgi:hypothetical protein